MWLNFQSGFLDLFIIFILPFQPRESDMDSFISEFVHIPFQSVRDDKLSSVVQ